MSTRVLLALNILYDYIKVLHKIHPMWLIKNLRCFFPTMRFDSLCFFFPSSANSHNLAKRFNILPTVTFFYYILDMWIKLWIFLPLLWYTLHIKCTNFTFTKLFLYTHHKVTHSFTHAHTPTVALLITSNMYTGTHSLKHICLSLRKKTIKLN